MAESEAAAITPDAESQLPGVYSRSFLGLLVTQFLSALNDNLFRWLIVPIGIELAVKGHEEDPLAIGAAAFIVPFLLLAAPAGYLADRFNKRAVIVGCKIAEVILLTLGIAAVLYGNMNVMYVMLFLLGCHSTLFGPSKYGALPELVRADRLATANGLVGMTTVLAIVLGTAGGAMLYDHTLPRGTNHWWVWAGTLIGVAFAGLAASLFIGPLRAANPQRRFPINLAGQTYRDMAALVTHRPLLLAALGSAVFWSIGALFQLNVYLFVANELGFSERFYAGILLAVLALGVGGGNVLAALASRGRIELGMIVWGAAGIALGTILLSTVPAAHGHVVSAGYLLGGAWLFLLGTGAGFYDVPLQSFLQHNSPDKSRGAILAAANFIIFTGMILASGAFKLLKGPLGMSPRGVFLLAGLGMLPVIVMVLYVVPIQSIRVMFRLLMKLLYPVQLKGLEHLPAQGGALLVFNHVSWLDGLLVLGYVPRPIHMIAYEQYVSGGIVGWLSKRVGTIPIHPGRPKAVVESLRTAREALQRGELVGIFPEGGLTRTGHMQPFFPGVLAIIKGTAAPVIPVYLGGLWGSIFSCCGGESFFKRSQRPAGPVTMLFGLPLQRVKDLQEVRSAVEQLGLKTMEQQSKADMILPRQFLRTCRRHKRRSKVADITGTDLTGAQMLLRTLIVRRLLRREIMARDERFLGLLLPPSVGGVLVNAALALDGRVSVNLNYTAGPVVLNECIRQCGIRHVLTSRRLLERFPLKLDAEILCVEDFLGRVTWLDKLTSALATYAAPVWLLERLLGLNRVGPNDLLTVLFTSGSTGLPKGVMLSHHNISSNIAAFSEVLDLRASDVMLGVLPFFHSFGFTATLWTALSLDMKLVYHYSPLEAKQIAHLSRQHGVTLMVVPPTFLRCYLRRCPPEDFKTLNTVVTGSEKLPSRLADEFQERFGIRPLEGYGATELSPAVSCNVPPGRARTEFYKGCKEGTVGRPMPGIRAKIVDLESGVELPAEQPGMLLITGPNVMQGYLNQPERTAEVLRDGWYVTGDVAVLDAEGFIRITGRQSRFAKIAGEMVPHIRVEEALVQVLSLDDDEALRVAVSSVPDAKRGERLIVLHTGLAETPEQVCRRLTESGLPPLWTPSPDGFYQVETIPILGSGKLDLKRLHELALEKTGQA